MIDSFFYTSIFQWPLQAKMMTSVTKDLYRSVDIAWNYWSVRLKMDMNFSSEGMQMSDWETIQEHNLEIMDTYFQKSRSKEHRNLLHYCNKWSLLLHQIMDDASESTDYPAEILDLINHAEDSLNEESRMAMAAGD